MSDHPSTLQLHRLRYGELDPAESRRLRDHLDACPRCADRLRSQEATRAAFVVEPVPPAIQALSRPRRSLRAWWWALPALAAAAGVLIAIPSIDTTGDGSEDVRTKGAMASLEVVAERAGQNVLLAPGSVVMPGDRIQLRFDPGDHAWAAFAGRDGSGVIQVYRVTRAEEGGMRPAPFGLELDDTPGDQELFAIFSDEPPDPVWVLDVIESGAAADGAVLTSIRLRKEVRR